MTIRCGEIFKLRKTTRELYVILGESAKDSAAFVVIYGYMVSTISTIMKAKLLRNSSDPGFPFYDRIFSTFALTLGFGYSPIADFEDGEGIQPGDWIIFILAMYVINILILNTLIAILGDSYDKVMLD